MAAVELKFEGAIAIATINRPEAMNALNADVLAELGRAVEKIESAREIRCAILTGAGDKAFVAGADIKRFENLSSGDAQALALDGQAILSQMEESKKPYVAAVNGFALGGGLELALACDFIYASRTAKLGLPECTLGLMPGFGGTVRLAARIGAGLARELAYSGAMITAEEARAAGLVNRVVEPGDLMKAALEAASLIASRAPLAVARIKHSMLRGQDLDQPRALELEARLFGELFETLDQKEGVRAFVEKRKPAFEGH